MRTRVLTAALVAALATASLAGCTASGASSTSAGGSAGSAADAPAFGADAPGTAAYGAKAPTADRSVVTTGTVHLVTDSPVQVADRITQLVESVSGHVARSTENPTGHPFADLTLRIPASVFPSTLTAIEQQGHLRDVAVNATDVTAQVTDYAVRIANLRTSITRLQQLLSKAASSADLVEIEGALTDRQGALEQLLAQQRTLTDQVTDATLSVSIVTPAAAPRPGPADFLSGLIAGTQGLVATLAALAVALGVVLPWAVVLAGTGAVVALVVRTVRRRRGRPTSA
ncbi:MAG: DUF4349 domain-containing protein [Acidobacteria bacterium]|nr:DUF4349 domain-containing protein [Acidobacteriota bacterium]